MPNNTLVVVNTTGRQAASVARVASALGYHVRAHVHQLSHPVAVELDQSQNVTVVEGSLEDSGFVAKLFSGVQRAFINTVSFGDELAIGKSLADAARKAGVQHYVYSSMPDHSVFGKKWPDLPLWSVKFAAENYIRQVILHSILPLIADTYPCRLAFLRPLCILVSTITILHRSHILFFA